jgi:hypothetical protein
MKTTISRILLLVAAFGGTAVAQPGPTDCASPCQLVPSPPPAPVQYAPAPAPQVATAQLAPQAPTAPPLNAVAADDMENGWHRPAGKRFFHGFRLGWTHIVDYDKPVMSRDGKSIKEQFGLKSPDMMLLGYEGFYRTVGHSWLNVLMVGNVTVAGLEQSKFIPAASGLIGFEFNESFQLGVGVNLTPDPNAPSHMIVAGGWTPSVGSIQTPIHAFYVPDPDHNHRMGVTVGMTW